VRTSEVAPQREWGKARPRHHRRPRGASSHHRTPSHSPLTCGWSSGRSPGSTSASAS